MDADLATADAVEPMSLGEFQDGKLDFHEEPKEFVALFFAAKEMVCRIDFYSSKAPSNLIH